MAPGTAVPVQTGACTDLYYIDTGMFETAEYGAVYVIDDDRTTIVDTGIGADFDMLKTGLADRGLTPADLDVIVPTHVHLDHAGGVGLLAERAPTATVYVHERGAPHLADPTQLIAGTKQAVGDQWRYYTEPVPVPEAQLQPLTDGDRIELGEKTLIARHAPGHARHQLVFVSPTDHAVFTGDAAGIYLPTRDRVQQTSPPATFNLEQARADLALLRSLDVETLLYAHFGPAQVADRLDRFETRLTEWVTTVQETRPEYADDEQLATALADTVDPALIEAWGEEKARGETKLNVRGVCQYLDYTARS